MARSGLIFLLVVGGLYAVALLFDAESALNALAFSSQQVLRLLPALALIFALLFLANLLVNPDWVRDNMGRNSGWRGWAMAVVGGILSVGPIYTWYPLLRELRDKGMRTALIAVFLYNRGIKLPLLPLIIQYFGITYTLLLAAYMTLFSLISGILVERLADSDPRA